MMKSVILLIVAAAVVAIIAPSARASLTASKAFATAPQSVFPLLDASTRLDMIDYYNSNLTTPSPNRLDGRSRITALSDRMASIELTPASSCDVVILPAAAGDTIIAVISTVATPAHDSHISFYTRDWKGIPTARLFEKPVLSDWLSDQGKKNRGDVEAMVPFLLISYTWDPSSNILTLTNNTKEFLTDDIYSFVKDYMLPTISYRWDGRKFSKIKD